VVFYLILACNSEVYKCGVLWTSCGETQFRIVVVTQVGSAIFSFILNLF
jgi:hypothetical protein